MKIKSGIILMFVILLFTLAGCSGKPMHLQQTDKQVQISEVDLSKGKEITASASGFQLLLWIPININSRHQNAYQALQAQAGKDYITDIKIEESWQWAFVGTVYTTTLKATAYPLKSKM
jgi:hypothetical protein